MATDLRYTVIKVNQYQSESDINKTDANVLYLVIDTISGSVLSHFSEKNLAYEDCYELNFPQIIEYNASPKENDGDVDFKLEEVPQETIDFDENISLPDKVNKEEISNNISELLKKLKSARKLRR
ncbi:hypothetical protein NIM72_06620 [Pantoea sp. B550]|jgi:hypothetical protein|uniref:hypothetical protein n=1 Tax=Pantoea TaxID=53335 RepID=UPI00165437D5|nr:MULTISPECIES: hypothetical protein [Pantoea]MCP1205229.1 hypothetical protein [Pantoea sp. B550]